MGDIIGISPCLYVCLIDISLQAVNIFITANYYAYETI